MHKHLQEWGRITPRCGKISLDECFVFSQAKIALEILKHLFAYFKQKSCFLPVLSLTGSLGLYPAH